MYTLCQLIHASRTIGSLSFSCGDKDLDDYAVDAVAFAVGDNITCFSLCDVVVSPALALRLGEALNAASSLVKLEFSHCEAFQHMWFPFEIVGKNIRELHIDSCHDEHDMFAMLLALVLPRFRELRRLRLSEQQIGPGDAHWLVKAFSELKHPLITLDMSDNLMDYRDYNDAVEKLLEPCVGALEELDLSANRIGRPGGLVLAELVAVNPGLRSVNISQNRIGEYAGMKFGRALKASRSSLVGLDISGCDFGSRGVTAVCHSVGDTVRKLYMNLNSMGDDGADAVVNDVLSPESSIDSLDLGENELSEEGAVRLSRGRCWSLRILILYGNQILAMGVGAILGAVKSPLEELCLCDCRIQDAGARAVGRFILARQGTCRMGRLCLARNGIGAQGVKAVVGSLGECKVRQLCLAGNDAGPEGTRVVAEGIIARNVGEVEELDIVDVGMRGEGATAIVRAILQRGSRSALRKLRVGGSYFTTGGVAELNQLKATHKLGLDIECKFSY